MINWLLTNAIKAHPITCVILTLYAGQVVWYSVRGKWGLIVYWFAAALITIAATWLRNWEK